MRDCSSLPKPLGFDPLEVVHRDSLVEALYDKYRMQINNVMFEQRLDWFPPKVRMEIEMDSERLEQFRKDLEKFIHTPLYDVPMYSTHTISFPSIDYGVGESCPRPPVETDDRPCMRCTKEQKEKFISMVEKYCNECFLDSNCEEQDDYDCRKCLERKVRWELTD